MSDPESSKFEPILKDVKCFLAWGCDEQLDLESTEKYINTYIMGLKDGLNCNLSEKDKIYALSFVLKEINEFQCNSCKEK